MTARLPTESHVIGELTFSSYAYNRLTMAPEAIARCLGLSDSVASAYEARYQTSLMFRGNQQVDTEKKCERCEGSGLIFVSINAWGDRISDICNCPAGDADRKYIDREEERIRRDERRRDERREDA